MKKTKKLLCTLLMGAFSTALWFGSNRQIVKADENTSIMPNEITIDYADQKLIITERNARDAEIICEFGKRKTVTTGKGSDRYSRDVCNFYTSSTYDYVNGLTIDLSSLKREQDNYIRLYGNYSESPTTIKIPAINTAVKAEFEPSTGIVKMYDITDKRVPYQYASEKIEYRNSYRTWQEYQYFDEFDDYDDLSKYQQRGATLYFRLKAEPTALLYTTAPTLSYGEVEDSEGDDIPYYEAFSFPGKELKVVIPPLPGAPKVKAYYDKQAFVLPKNTEYRIVTGTSNANMKWFPAKANASLQVNMSDIAEKYGNVDQFTFEARVMQTEKKPASRLYRQPITIPKTPTIKSIRPNPAVALEKQNIDQNCLQDEYGSDAFYIQYVYNAKKKRCTKVEVTNNFEEAYELYVANGGGVPSPTTSGVLTAKATTESMSSVKVTTFSISKLKDGSKLYIRQKANAKLGQFSSPWTLFGVVSHPEEEPDY